MLKSFTIDTDYSSYDVIRATRIDDICEKLEKYDVPYIRDTVNDMEVANAWTSPNVRQYAYAVLMERSFPITHPKSGKTLRLSATHTFDDYMTVFFFLGDSPVGIVSSDGSAGFPLSSIVLFDEKVILHLTESFWGIREQHFAKLITHGDQTIHERADDCEVCLVAGDSNFAHYAWNELSALQEIAAVGFDESISIALAHEPLGPVNAILGSDFIVKCKVARARMPEVNRSGALTFCATGIVINRQLADKIVKFADENLSAVAAEVRDEVIGHGPRSLWVSVRTRNRTIGSQVDVLTAVVQAYLQDRPDRMVIIDGHSIPFDHEQDADYIRDLNESIVADDGIVADQIIARVKAALPEANIIRFVGQKIHESIAVGRHVGFYFCHHGSVQHKLGWFSSVPGLVHCNREALQLRPDEWVRSKSAVAALPIYVPLDLVDEVVPDHELSELQKHLAHSNYEISDHARAARIVCEFADTIECAPCDLSSMQRAQI